MRVFAVSASFLLALGLASPRGALAQAPEAAAPVYVPGPAPYVVNAPPAEVAAKDAPSAAVGPVDTKKILHPLFFGLTAGVAMANPNLQGLAPVSMTGATVGMQAGYTLNPHFSLGFEFNTIEKKVSRLSSGAPFSVPLQAQADCTTCTAPLDGGWVTQTTLFFGHLAPRLEFTPFGENGLFISAAAGLAVLQLVDTRAGFSGAVRAGYRFRVAKIIDFGIEAGAQGQAYADGGSVTMFSGTAVLRPHF